MRNLEKNFENYSSLFLSSRELAAILSVSISTIDRWKRENRLPFQPLKIVRRVLWKRSDVENFINQRQ